MDARRLTFYEYGRSYHLAIEEPADLEAAAALDAALWVVTAAPLEGLRADPVLLRNLDRDGDQRIRVGEFKDAIRWLFSRLAEHRGIAEATTTLDPAALRTDDAEGAALQATLQKIITSRTPPHDGGVTLAEIRALIRDIEARPVGSSGIILPEAAKDEETRAFLEAVLATTGGRDAGADRQGVGPAELDRFLSETDRYLNWHAEGLLPAGVSHSALLPLGPGTAAAAAALAAVQAKVDEYFTLCDAIALGEVLRCDVWPARLDTMPSVLSGVGEVQQLLERSPAAEPRMDRTLNLEGPVNPWYAPALAVFRRDVLVPLTGREDGRVSKEEWDTLKTRLQPFRAWQEACEGRAVEPIGAEALRRFVDSGMECKVRALLDQSLSSGFALGSVVQAEKLALYQGELMALANNFVSFPDLYAIDRRALFEEGTLIMDGRRFSLAVRVFDRAEHLRLTENGTMFVLYVQLNHKPTERTREVAVAVTSGTQGQLEVGKRGVFEDVEGIQWQARVVHLVDRPVSLREAMTEPFVRLGRAITSRIELMSQNAEKQLDQAGGDSIGLVHEGVASAPTPQAPPAAASGPSPMGGMLAGGGIALAALGGSIAFILKTLATLRWHQILIGLGGALMAVLVPTVIIALLRLRSRDLSVLLEGAGWAVNARMRLSRRQSRIFTRRPPHPRGSRFHGGTRSGWWWLLVTVLAALLLVGGTLLRRRAVDRELNEGSAAEGIPDVGEAVGQ